MMIFTACVVSFEDSGVAVWLCEPFKSRQEALDRIATALRNYARCKDVPEHVFENEMNDDHIVVFRNDDIECSLFSKDL